MDAVGFAFTETVMASSRFCVMLNPVMEKSASSPVPAPSETNSASGVLLKYAVWKAVKSVLFRPALALYYGHAWLSRGGTGVCVR